jgi:hypothetical protein
MPAIANDDELAATFNTMKTPAFNFGQECPAPDFTFDTDNGPAHDTATICSFRVKHPRNPYLRNRIAGLI